MRVIYLLLLATALAVSSSIVPAHGQQQISEEQYAALQEQAKNGDATAQNELGLLSASGADMGNHVGFRSNLSQAVHYYRLAANRGLAAGEYNLGNSYALGRGVLENFVEAARWYRLAADQGHAEAQGGLGVLYADGKGLPQNFPLAYQWLSLAIPKLPDDRAQVFAPVLESVTAKLTPEQLEEEKNLVAEWKPGEPVIPPPPPNSQADPKAIPVEAETCEVEVNLYEQPFSAAPDQEALGHLSANSKVYVKEIRGADAAVGVFYRDYDSNDRSRDGNRTMWVKTSELCKIPSSKTGESPVTSASRAAAPNPATSDSKGSSLENVPWFLLIVLTLTAVAFVMSRRKRKAFPPDSFVEPNTGIPYAKSFKWTNGGGFEVVIESLHLEVTGDAVIINKVRYRRSAFKGFTAKQAARAESSGGGTMNGSELYFTYGDTPHFLAVWRWRSRGKEYFGDQAIASVVAALNDRIQAVPQTGRGQQDSEQLRNDRPSDF